LTRSAKAATPNLKVPMYDAS